MGTATSKLDLGPRGDGALIARGRYPEKAAGMDAAKRIVRNDGTECEKVLGILKVMVHKNLCFILLDRSTAKHRGKVMESLIDCGEFGVHCSTKASLF